MTRLVLPAALAGVLMCASLAFAASLGEADYRYLKSEFGIAKDDRIVADMNSQEQAALHDLLNDEISKDNPYRRHQAAASYLYKIHLRECQAWAQSHAGQECPPGSDANAEPGRKIAERQCNTCHLFGTTDAPSFYRLAKQGRWTAERLADALGRGHQMSPITLQPGQSEDLATYIASLNR